VRTHIGLITRDLLNYFLNNLTVAEACERTELSATCVISIYQYARKLIHRYITDSDPYIMFGKKILFQKINKYRAGDDLDSLLGCGPCDEIDECLITHLS
jgi:hypothetical protein